MLHPTHFTVLRIFICALAIPQFEANPPLSCPALLIDWSSYYWPAPEAETVIPGQVDRSEAKFSVNLRNMGTESVSLVGLSFVLEMDLGVVENIGPFAGVTFFYPPEEYFVNCLWGTIIGPFAGEFTTSFCDYTLRKVSGVGECCLLPSFGTGRLIDGLTD